MSKRSQVMQVCMHQLAKRIYERWWQNDRMRTQSKYELSDINAEFFSFYLIGYMRWLMIWVKIWYAVITKLLFNIPNRKPKNFTRQAIWALNLKQEPITTTFFVLENFLLVASMTNRMKFDMCRQSALSYGILAMTLTNYMWVDRVLD